MTRQRLPKAERRELIEAAAEELFAARGYPQTRLEDVAAAAGVSKQLLQRHFATKAVLHLALLTKHRDQLLAALRDADADPVARARAWFGYVHDHPYAARLLFADTSGLPEALEFHERARAEARAVVASLLRLDPAIGAADLEPLAEMARAATVGLALWWVEHPERSLDEIVALAVRAWTGS